MNQLRITNYELRITNNISALRLCAFAGIIFSFCLIFAAFANAQGLPVALPQTVGMSAEKLNQIDALIEKDILDKKLPGAVVLVGHKGKIVFRKAYGNRSLVPTVEKMTVDTIFDVASLTKVVATTTSVMILVERGQIRLSDTIGKFIPEIEDENAKRVTIQQLLTHVSGYAPDFDLREKWTGREGMLQALKKERLKQPAGTKFVYSDIGFIVLGEIVQRVSGKAINDFSSNNIFQKSGMTNSEFIPCFEVDGSSANDNCFVVDKKNISQYAPTENIKGQQSYLGSKFEGDEKAANRILRGFVHDPTSFRMNGVAGHAGLFSTADDLARFCQMLLNGGILNGKRILSAATVARMTAPVVVSEDGAARGLGWDINSAFSSNRGELFPLGSFGHTGFTGTSIWIDRVSQTFVVFLSNRVHPDGKGDVTPLRAKIATVVASALEDTPIETTRLAEDIYWSQVAPQIEKFKVQSSKLKVEDSAIRNPQSAIVLNGIDVLEKNNFKELNGLKIGLVTNHTGRNLAGRQTIDILKESANVKLVALFAPEHGIRGLVDEKVSDSVDEKTGLPIYSLYGDTRRPKPEQLKDLDAIVFDIQDIGVRFYTYISTLQNVLEEASKAGKPVFVLDRPNPINGVDIEGAIADADKLTFVATHTLPVRHAMTIGEIAQMFNAEKKINADLRVVKMENWTRSMWFDQTNQIWTNPSPNMRSLTEATLYPGIGMMEYTNISVGRGTDTPFEIVGAPWIDGQKLAAFLNEKNFGGVRFVPVRFTPKASVFKDEMCGGINIVITSREQFKPVKTGVEIALALHRLFPNDWKMDKYNGLLVNSEIFEMVRRDETYANIENAWQNKLNEFKSRRAQFLLYK
ncbi:MAG: exo-beta-N-acetylmuramidase NamZ domain-containing protein [Pyrinomonadaceae bacterium]